MVLLLRGRARQADRNRHASERSRHRARSTAKNAEVIRAAYEHVLYENNDIEMLRGHYEQALKAIEQRR